jgi:hypothetical protein
MQMPAVKKIAAAVLPPANSWHALLIFENPVLSTDSPCDYNLLSLLEETGELPELPDENRLFLCPVDPHQIFSCWTIRKTDVDMLTRKISCKYRKLEAVLRFYDITGIAFCGNNAHSYFDVEIDMQSGKRFIALWRAGRQFIADLGFRNEYGVLYPVCRSNIAQTPGIPFMDEGPVREPAEISGSALSQKIVRAFMPGVSSHHPCAH